MAWTLAEGLANTVAAYYTAKLQAKLTSLETELGLGAGDLGMPTIYKGEKAVGALPSHPSLCVLVERTVIEDWTGARVHGDHRLLLVVIDLDQDYETLQLNLYRYARALFEVMADAHGDATFTPVVGVGMVELDFGPVYTNRQSQYLADCQVRIPMVMRETR